MDAALAIAGTLLGTLLGTLGARLNYGSAFRREASERLATVRRESYVELLTEINVIYRQIREASSSHRQQEISGEEMWRQLMQISPIAGQASLETVRLVATDSVAAVAAELWAHVRRAAVPRAHDNSTSAWRTWQERYWALRREFIDAARADTGFAPLDWSTAGVHNR